VVKTIRKVGNGDALPLDTSVMELLNLRTGSEVNLTVSGNQLIVTPASVGLSDEQVDRSLAKFRKRHDKAFKALAK
jgi:antitoxin component of MazEF toxin-antitoxin module